MLDDRSGKGFYDPSEAFEALVCSHLMLPPPDRGPI
jgi:hypothetical protein